MNENLAKIGVNKSLLKEFDVNGSRTVYMEDGTEFQIQLFNSYQHKIAVDIYIENESIGNQLILDPGERCWLERFMDKHSKFKFRTYTVEGDAETRNAIAHNGEIKIIYRRVERKHDNYLHKTWADPYGTTYISKGIDLNTICLNSNANYASNTVANSMLLGASIENSVKSSNLDLEYTTVVDTIETGRIDEGSYSSQSFTTIDVDIKETLKTEYIKILPQSQKPYTTSDLHKIYCVECGHKLNQRYKYCPYCGTKVE